MKKIELIRSYLRKAREAYDRGTSICQASGKTIETVNYDDLFWSIINELKVALWGEELCDWIDWRLYENGTNCSFGNDTDHPRIYNLKSDEEFILMLSIEYDLSDEDEPRPAWHFQEKANKMAEKVLEEDDLYTAEDFAEYFERFIKSTVANANNEKRKRNNGKTKFTKE